jgi:DNA repair photolyase
LIPGLNTDYQELIRTASQAGASHLVSSTFKPRPDAWKRFRNTFPEIARELRHLYFEKGKRIQGSRYLPKEVRLLLMKDVKKEAQKYDMSFGVCREGLNLKSAKSCDGSHLLL